MQMAGESLNRRFNIYFYYMVCLLALGISGLIYKIIFIVYNYSQFSSLPLTDTAYALVWGLRFDLAAAAFLSLTGCLVLWLFYRLGKFNLAPAKNPAVLLLSIMLLVQISLQIGDTLYYAESGRHVSYEMRDALTDASGLFMTAITNHSLFILLAYLFSFALVFIVWKMSAQPISTPLSGTVPNSAAMTKLGFNFEIKLFSLLLLSVIMVRGGVTGLPQSVISAFKIGDARQAIVAMNGAYSVIYGVLNSAKEINQVSVKLPDGVNVNSVMNTLYPEIPEFSSADEVNIKKYNLVFILMEGWPADLMSAYGFARATTPFFESLKDKAISPLGAFAGGVRTTEGIYAVFCSQQNPLGETVAQSSLQNNQYRCLPDILKQQGWHTAFFQGTHKETSGTGAFAQSLGFTESFAKEDMPAGRYAHNYWGAHDPDIYDFLLDKLDDMPQPFLVGVNTNSTHDDKLPAGEKFHFGDANRLQRHMSVLHFADKSMRDFFDNIKTRPYYGNTVFVLLSDHTLGRHKSIAAKYFIPGVIYSESLLKANTVERYVSQRDFAPTVLDIIGMPASSSFSGKSFWYGDQQVDQEEFFADYFDSGSVGWLSDDILVETSVKDPSRMKCYSIADNLLNANSVECNEDYKYKSTQSLVFTSYSQNLLFKGRTKNFYEFTDK